MAQIEQSELVRATGLAVALIGLLLEGHAVLSKGEFSRHIANLALITGEDDPLPGEILTHWAAIAAQVGGPATH